MKKLLLLITSICLWQISFSQTVPLICVLFCEGKKIGVYSKVQCTFLTKGEKKTTCQSFVKPSPNANFTAVIIEGDVAKFKYTPAEFLKDKNICITGKVTNYKDKLQMIIESEEQVKVE